jgi:hypothetical protein
MSDAERKLREAADLAFLFQDYEMAYCLYKTAISDFKVMNPILEYVMFCRILKHMNSRHPVWN